MPRARLIHPEFFTDPKLGKVSPEARLLFAALWVYGDDAGLHLLDLAQLRVEAFPHEKDATDYQVGGMVMELVRQDYRVVPYVGDDGQTYLCTRNFLKRQPIKYPSKAQCPLPPFLAFSIEEKPTRTVYRYAVDKSALRGYLKDQVEEIVENMSGTCGAQVGNMFPRTKRTERTERKGLDLPATQGAPIPPGRSRSTPSLSQTSNPRPDKPAKPTAPTLPACLTAPSSLLLAAQSGLVALVGHELDKPALSTLESTLAAMCSRCCPVRSVSPVDKAAKYLPVCRRILAAALSAMPHPSAMPDPSTIADLFAELARLFEARRKDFIAELLAVDGVDGENKEAGNP